MPALRNSKHETFANELVTCQGNATEAYNRVYGVDGHVAEANGCRLLKRAEVKRRFHELLARKSRTTLDSLASQFDEVFDGAMAKAHFGAAGAAAQAKAKLLGFMRERIEVGGPGTFDNLSTPMEVVRKLMEDTDDAAGWPETLRFVADEIERQLSDCARSVSEVGHMSGTKDKKINDINETT